MNNRFANKVALVTGGSSGIGREAALEFAREGATVVVASRRETESQETVSLIEKAGGKAFFVMADVSKEADVANLVGTIEKRCGRLDAAFNNAGIEGTVFVPTHEQTEANYRKVFDINVLGVMLSMKYEIPLMLKNGGGAIVNTSSIAGMIGFPGMSVYCASKHAVVGLTRSAALEYAKQGVRVNVISPGAIETEMYERFTGSDTSTQDQIAGMHPVGRAGRVEEIAKVLVFMCSGEASFVTGANIPVDGGYTAQ